MIDQFQQNLRFSKSFRLTYFGTLLYLIHTRVRYCSSSNSAVNCRQSFGTIDLSFTYNAGCHFIELRVDWAWMATLEDWPKLFPTQTGLISVYHGALWKFRIEIDQNIDIGIISYFCEFTERKGDRHKIFFFFFLLWTKAASSSSQFIKDISKIGVKGNSARLKY